MRPLVPFGIFIKDTEGQIVGGIQGYGIYGCLHIDMFWVSPHLRHQGVGSKLIQEFLVSGREKGLYLCDGQYDGLGSTGVL